MCLLCHEGTLHLAKMLSEIILVLKVYLGCFMIVEFIENNVYDKYDCALAQSIVS